MSHICCPCRQHIQPLPLWTPRVTLHGPPRGMKQAVRAAHRSGSQVPTNACSVPRAPALDRKHPVIAHAPRRKQRPRSRKENQDPVCLEGFISIQLHSRASRFLISHLTIKDRPAGLGPRQPPAWLSRGSLPGEGSGTAAGSCHPVPAAARGGASSHAPRGSRRRAPTANRGSPGGQRPWETPEWDEARCSCRGGQPGPERAVVWPRPHSKAPASSLHPASATSCGVPPPQPRIETRGWGAAVPGGGGTRSPWSRRRDRVGRRVLLPRGHPSMAERRPTNGVTTHCGGSGLADGPWRRRNNPFIHWTDAGPESLTLSKSEVQPWDTGQR